MKIIDIALKDLTRSFRSLFAIGMMFVAPLLITGLMYMAFGGLATGKTDLPATRLVVVNLDQAPAGGPAVGDALVQMFSDPSVSKWLDSHTATDEASAVDQVNHQQAGVAVIIPAGFSQSILSGQGQPVVRILQDPTLTIGPAVVKNMIGSLLDGVAGMRVAIQTDANRRQALGLPVSDTAGLASASATYQQWYTAFQKNLYHSAQAGVIAQAPGQDVQAANDPSNLATILRLVLVGMAVFFGFYTGAYSMMSILTEQEEGTLARLFTTPTGRTAILAGKFLSVVLMVIVQALVMLVMGVVLFRVSWGNPLNVAIALIGQVAAATGLGVLLISLVKSSKQAGPVLGGGLTFLAMLGGLFTVAVPNAPKALELTSVFTPHGWVLKIWRLALDNASLPQMLGPLAVLVIMGVVMFFAGAYFFQKRFA